MQGPSSPRRRGVADAAHAAHAALAGTWVGRIAGLRHASAASSAKTRGILRRGEGRRAGGGGAQAARVQWRAVLVAGEDDAEEVGEERSRMEAQVKFDQRLQRYYKLLRLPTLTYEELAIPLRCAFPADFASLLAPIVLDVAVDLFEVVCVVYAVRREFRAYALEHHAMADAAPRAFGQADVREGAAYTVSRLVVDLVTIFSLAAGRVAQLRAGLVWPWQLAQLFRLIRLRDLGEYMAQLNADLTTNVTVFAIFKFALVVFSVPHWVGCVWWIISSVTPDRTAFHLPSWTAQYDMHVGVPGLFDPTRTTAVRSYMMAQYMAWSGVASMGYGSITLVKQSEIWFGCLIILVQIVFYAFVLGTLFHYLVRTDENTVKFKELLKAVEEYAVRRRLPPTVARKMLAHFEFQHRKQSSGTEAIFLQLPLSLRLRVASARYHAQIEHAWVFHGCNAQFLNQLVMVLKERYVMPLEMLFDRGDGSRELLWCTSGTLHVRKGDAHIATIRSDLGNAPIVGEIAFILGIVQPYTVVASGASEVTLLVLSVSDFDDIITSYPEQADVVVQNLLRHFALSRDGTDLGGGLDAVADSTMNDDERAEFEALRETVRQALNDRNDEALTKMTYAASEGDVDTVRALAARGLNLNAGDYDNRTTMHLACAEGNARVVALLCQLGADPNVRDRWNGAPIKDAIEGKHETVLDVLRQAGVALDVAQPAHLMCEAAGRGDLDRLNRLLENGILANLGDYDGRTPLHLAAASGNMRVVEFLVSKLADVSAQDLNGATPADDAVTSERTLVTQLLVRSGSRPNPLSMLQSMCEAAAAGDVGLVRFLVETGVSVDAGDYDGRTALHLACAAGSISTTHFLIGAMADVEARDRWGNTAIVDALWTSNECAALLVQQCNAKLPPQHERNPELSALYVAAKAQDMYVTNRKLNERAARRRRLQLLRRDRSRELRLALKQLVDEIGLLYRAARPLFTQLLRHTDRWIESYGYQGGDSDGDSQDSMSDDDWSDYDSDNEVPDGARGSHGECGSARGHAESGVPSVRRGSGVPVARRGSGVHARRGSSELKPAALALAPAPLLAPGAAAAPAADASATAKTFIRLVLRLPRAEKALSTLALVVGRRLAPGAFKALAKAERLAAEHAALVQLLVADFELAPHDAEAACDEIYAELKLLLGDRAPRRPRAPRRGKRAGAAGGGGAAADVSRSLAGWLKGGSRGVGDNISPPKAASGGGVVSPSAVSPSATACALVAADAAPSAARLADDAVEGGGNSGSFGQSGTPPASSGTRAPRRSARASVSSMIGGLMASFAIGDRAPRPSGPSDSDSAARTDDDEESDGDDEHNVCIFLSQVGYAAVFLSASFMALLARASEMTHDAHEPPPSPGPGNGRSRPSAGMRGKRRSLWSTMSQQSASSHTPHAGADGGGGGADGGRRDWWATSRVVPMTIALHRASSCGVDVGAAAGDGGCGCAVRRGSSLTSSAHDTPKGGTLACPPDHAAAAGAGFTEPPAAPRRMDSQMSSYSLYRTARGSDQSVYRTARGSDQSVYRTARGSDQSAMSDAQPVAGDASVGSGSHTRSGWTRPVRRYMTLSAFGGGGGSGAPSPARPGAAAADGAAAEPGGRSSCSARGMRSPLTLRKSLVGGAARGSAPPSPTPQPAREDLKAAVAPAAMLMVGLFQIFDPTSRGIIKVRDLRSLQGSLGEMGGQEIKSLITHLFDKSTGVYGTDEGSVGRSGRQLSKVQFFAGAASWILAQGEDDDVDAERDGDGDGSGDSRARAGGERGVRGGGSKLVPALRLGGARASGAGGGGGGPVGTSVGTRNSRVSRNSTAEDDAADADAAAGGTLAPTGSHSMFPPSALHPAHVEQTLRMQLSSAPFLAALADAIQMRIDLGRLRRDEAVDSATLVSLILNAVAIDPRLVRRSDVEAWALDELNLEISERGVERTASKRRGSLNSVLGAAAGALESISRRNSAGGGGGASDSAAVRVSHGASARGSVSRRSSGAAAAAAPLSPGACAAAFAAATAAATAATAAEGVRVRARWRELVVALRAQSAQLRQSGKAAGTAVSAMLAPLAPGFGERLRHRLGLRPSAREAQRAAVAAAALTAATAAAAAADVDGGGGGGGGGAGGVGAQSALVLPARTAAGKPWFIVSHVSRTHRLLERLYRVCFMWEVLTQPAVLCFWEQTHRIGWLSGLSHFLDCFYVLRIALRLHTSFVNAKSVIIYDPVEIRAHYLATEFSYDVFMSWPHNFFALALSAPAHTVISLRLVRLGLARYLWRAYAAWEKRQADNDLLAGLLRFLGILLLAAHFAACMWNLLGFEYDGVSTLELSDGPPADPTYTRTWPAQFNGLFHDAGATDANDFLSNAYSNAWMLVRRYAVALNLSLAMLSGLGINHLPTNYVEIAAYVGMLIGSMTIYAWTVGQISALVMKQDDEIVTKRSQLELVHAYLTHIDVPAELKAHVEGFFHARLRDASFSSVRDEDIANAMPIALQIEVSRHTNRQLVGEAKLLRGCSDAFMDRLSSLLRERALEPETQLFREGDVCKELLLVESGSVELWQGAAGASGSAGDDDDDLQIAIAGDTVGELPFVFGIRHFNNGRTASDVETHVFVLSTANYRILLKTFPLQEDKVMDNAMLQYDGMLTGRSGKSKASAKSSILGSALTETESQYAASAAGSAVNSQANAVAHTEEEAIQRVIKTAKKRREDMHVVRLCEAAAKGDLGKIQRILSSNRIDVNRGDYDKRRPLHLAACEGHLQVIELLIVAQADVNVKDRFDGTPLADALRHRKLAAAELLHRHGAFRDTSGLSEQLCFCAAEPKRLEELRFLTRFQTDFAADNYEARTALHVAAAVGNLPAARLLIGAKADVNAIDRRGRTPLQDSFRHGHEDCSRLLMEHGAHMGTFDAALHMCYAAAADDLDTLSRLIRHRCAVNVADYDKRTPLHLAASNARTAACTLLLEQPGVNVAAEDRFGNTALDDAERENGPDQPIVRALLRTRGVPIGSHEMVMQVAITHAEEIKADVEAKQTEVQRDVAEEAQRFSAWVAEQRAGALRMQKAVDAALALEVEQGEVLTDATPKYWNELQAFADRHPARLQMVEAEMRPAIASWSARASQNRFEISMMSDLERRLTHLVDLQTGIAKHLERLAQTEFTQRAGSGAEAERNAASNARVVEGSYPRRGSSPRRGSAQQGGGPTGRRGSGNVGSEGWRHTRDQMSSG